MCCLGRGEFFGSRSSPHPCLTASQLEYQGWYGGTTILGKARRVCMLWHHPWIRTDVKYLPPQEACNEQVDMRMPRPRLNTSSVTVANSKVCMYNTYTPMYFLSNVDSTVLITGRGSLWFIKIESGKNFMARLPPSSSHTCSAGKAKRGRTRRVSTIISSIVVRLTVSDGCSS